MLDDQDRALLRRWQDDPDLSPAQLAEAMGLPAARVSRRIARLQEAGVLTGLRAVIDWRALGYGVEISLRITLEKSAPRAFDEFLAAAREVPEVVEIQTFLGRVDVRLGVIARDLHHWQALWRDRILTLPHLADIEALMTVATVKAEEALPL
ncbi:Lrp/AsnC family transcriptional regulator [Wenxinia saemankumensis]|uniref:Lrp/AsnC family transcriptional regulator n=1 Tax=Wenxinia saemankumensis TaxID=1447782 RepID=A0A1M6HBB4_9RHOB|nr:Lrp/AsnC family transcriptional regulator [Wenxinia saemankumensis]SHJ19502.1 Lrp/AsnC family transcriptional regulator [Wenxinia saemankumensis]